MEQGPIVVEGRSRQGKSVLTRSLQQNDAEALCHYMHALSEERTFVRFQGEQFTLEEETAYRQFLPPLLASFDEGAAGVSARGTAGSPLYQVRMSLWVPRR